MKFLTDRRKFVRNSLVLSGALTVPAVFAYGGNESEKNQLREWYCCMGLVFRETPADNGTSRICGVTVKRNEWPVFFNLSGNQANIVLTIYFEDQEPFCLPVKVKPRASHVIELHKMEEIPEGKLMAFKVVSDQPVVVQFSYSEDGMSVPEKSCTMSGAGSRIAHQGPLGKRELKWVHADGHTRSADKKAADIDWFLVFNPGETMTAEVDIHLSWADQVLNNHITVPPRRVRVYKPGSEENFHFAATFGLTFESNTPVVVEGLRRWAWNNPFISINQWTAPSLPVGDIEIV